MDGVRCHHGGHVPTKAERSRLLLYYRLVLSYSDFKHAYRCAQYIIAEHDSFSMEGGDDLLLRALYSSLVVSYARPFNSTGASRIGRIPSLSKELLSVLSDPEREVHSYILLCRNKLIAHSDAEAIDPAPFVATDLSKPLVIPDKEDALAPFSKDYMSRVLPLTEKAYHWSVEERYRLEPTIEHLLDRKPWGVESAGTH